MERVARMACCSLTLLRPLSDMSDFAKWCRDKGLHEDALDVICAALLTDVAQLPASLTKVQQRRVQDVLRGTWFFVAGDLCPVHTERGTRPGDPLADLIYGFVMAGALREIESAMLRAHLAPDVSLGGILPGNDPGQMVCAPSIAWHDDAAFVFCSPTAADLRGVAADTDRIVWTAFHSRGLDLSFAAGKSEVILHPLGAGSDRVRRELFSPTEPCVFFLPEVGCMRKVGIAKTYVHLGSAIDATLSLLPDIRRRLQWATEAASP